MQLFPKTQGNSHVPLCSLPPVFSGGCPLSPAWPQHLLLQDPVVFCAQQLMAKVPSGPPAICTPGFSCHLTCWLSLITQKTLGFSEASHTSFLLA